ncbi:hypothetical protein DTL42_19635 [Bremerella cremea]|uniref:Prenyltransferase alpha-alpha toroid domain-containing protein n=1 Tax=Bremerella cremea TaxID=1031537 RepID=A0A368KLP2_9BACT|nr:ankyrin repeat domain-containing protein [Bremerella cremea]RCS42044.1 hypothetical protein DTL42_19635 [Bremerella cremea]
MDIHAESIHRFLDSLLRDDGGYANAAGKAKSSLSSTNSVLKALDSLDCIVSATEKTVDFVRSCHDGVLGGFAQQPGAEADGFTTASALMLLNRLGGSGAVSIYQERAVQFMNSKARTQYDHFMTIAAYEECDITGSSPDKAIAYFQAKASDDTPNARVLDNAITFSSLLRAGQPFKNKPAVIDLLLQRQRDDGGFGDGDSSDLFTTYCVLRCLVLLKTPPNVRRLQRYLSQLRRKNGFAATRGEAASAGATYQVLSILQWISDLQRDAVDMARAGDVTGLSKWLVCGGDPNIYDSDGWTVLLAASAYGKHQVVDFLLNNAMHDVPNADPCLRFCGADALPIYMAGQSGDVKTVEILLKAKPEHLHAISTVNGHTVFLQAAFYGKSVHLDLARYLLDNCCSLLGSPPDQLPSEQKRLTTATNVRGYTGLTMQHLWHNEKMSELLSGYPQPTEEEKETYLDDLLLRIADAQSLSERLIHELRFWQNKAAAVEDGAAPVDQQLVEQALVAIDRIASQSAFEIDRLASSLYQPPLIYAITGVDRTRSGAEMRFAIVKYLLDKKADPKVREKHPMGIGSVIRASVLNQFELLKLVADYMTKQDFADEMNTSPAVNGLTAMHDAVHRALTAPAPDLQPHLNKIRWMLQRGARIDIPDHTGQTQKQLAIEAHGDPAFSEGNVRAVWEVLGLPVCP